MRVLKDIFGFLHAEPLHDGTRPEIANRAKRHDFRQAEQFKANT
jgi:hypothetical protein